MTAVTHTTGTVNGLHFEDPTRGLIRPLPPSVYRRRRTLAVATLATVVFLVSLVATELVGHVNGSPGSTLVGAAGEPVVYVVQPGDTLWEIAERIGSPGVDLRYTVDRLATAAGGPLLRPGQRITLPTGL